MGDELKSALQLALEKLDLDESMQVDPLSEVQKTRIQELRARYKAKLAETEIHFSSLIQKAVLSGDRDEARRLAGRQKKESDDIEQKLEREVAKIRANKA